MMFPRRAKEQQILNSVVVLAMIYVMNNFSLIQHPAQVLFHDQPMFGVITLAGCAWMLGRMNETIPLPINDGLPVPDPHALIAAIDSGGLTLLGNKRLSTGPTLASHALAPLSRSDRFATGAATGATGLGRILQKFFPATYADSLFHVLTISGRNTVVNHYVN